jgi:hypothetical protein
MYGRIWTIGKSTFAIAILIILSGLSSNLPAAELTRGAALDSIFFSEFKAVYYELRADYIRKSLELVIYKNDVETISEKYEWLTLFNFCFDLNDTTAKCFSKDINSDGTQEFIIIGIGERKNTDMAVIYSLADSISELARFEDINGFHLKDLDSDKIPELIFKDNSFKGMYVEGYGAPRPPVIWQRGDEGYKIANFKYSDYIINEFEKYHPRDSIKSYDEWVSDFGIPYCHDQYLRYVFQYTVTYFFAGQYRAAWDIINKYIPKSFTIRRHSRFDITYNQKYSPYWDDIEQSNKLPIDSVKFGDYRIYLLQNHDGNNKPSSMFNDVAIYRGDKKVEYLAYSGHEFGQPQDINNDGIPELVISEYTGGANCCFGGYVYSFGDTLKQILRFEPSLTNFDMKDIDSDSIYEFLWHDDCLAYWNDIYRFYFPPLIWDWNGKKYKLRNFAFSEYILKGIEEKAIKILDPEFERPMKGLGYDTSNMNYTPGDLWEFLMLFSYAGKMAKADSIFEKYGNPEIIENTQKYELFKLTIQSSSYWQKLLDSNW